MDKNILKGRLDEVKNQLRANSKDAHFFDKLIDEALCLKGQLCIEPTVLDCGKEIDELMGDTFRLTLTDKGVLYHEFGGYSVFATVNNQAMYGLLEDVVKNKEKFTADDETYVALMQIVAYNLSMPRIAFLDFDFARENALRMIEYIDKMYKEYSNKELQTEDMEKNTVFREASLGLEALNKIEEEAR